MDHSKSISVAVAQPERDVEARLFGIGTVEAQVSSRIGFQVAGRIVQLETDQGQILDEGKIIARLDSAVQQARVQKAHVAVQQSDTALVRAQALLARAQVNHVQKQAIAERRQALVDRGAATREATDEARTQAEIAKADVQVAEAEVSVATVARTDIAASAAIEEAILDQHTLVTPFRSRIIARLKEAGSAVNPAESVFSIIAPETVWVRAFIDEATAGALKLGQTAYVRLRSEPNRVVEAEVVRIDEENDRITEERRIYVRCRKCSPEHLGRNLGEQAEVEVLTRKIESGIFVPLYAVSEYNGRSGVVWVVENGRLAKRRLALADRLLDGRALVAEPLPTGLSIVTERDASSFREGRAARAGSHP
ncbi:MAG: efflux transporter, family, subunit [Hyphomicrobiales bacterium]|nr:efflux transporter, family, subunit [Hyphomicrobiales bacterium]